MPLTAMPLQERRSGAQADDRLAPDAALAGLGRVPGAGRHRLVPAAAALHERPEDEQAGDPRRVQGTRRQSADQVAHPPPAARPAAPPHDAGGSDRHRRDRQSRRTTRWPSATRWTPWRRRSWWPRARTTWRCASAQKAIEHQVPIVENPPLAQALYKSVEVGQEIPAHLYRAVAEILAYIYRLMGGRLPA